MGRLLATHLRLPNGTLVNRHDYVYNLASQRTYQTRTDGSYVHYDYDALGQLTGALGSGGQSRERLGYAYDPAWNLAWRTNSGTALAFQVDGLNQLTNSPDGRQYYDPNGNLTNAAGLTYAYDDENRLVVLTQPGAPGNWRTEFVYDGLGRLRVRREFVWFSSTITDLSLQSAASKKDKKSSLPVQSASVGGGEGFWFLDTETRYVYDGRRVIHERGDYDLPLVNYTRGNDLSGSLEGAGGIGGLLARTAAGSHAYYHADGNGNVTCLLATNKSLAARYVYDPYGNLLSQYGTLADANVYRFSSKEFHPRSGLYYYLYRWYDPRVQRWVNRDPIGEIGGANLFSFVRNAPGRNHDAYGLMTNDECHRAADEWKLACKLAATIVSGVLGVGGAALCTVVCATVSGGTATAPCLWGCRTVAGLGGALLATWLNHTCDQETATLHKACDVKCPAPSPPNPSGPPAPPQSPIPVGPPAPPTIIVEPLPIYITSL
jgi:RHS repeat-associated protein